MAASGWACSGQAGRDAARLRRPRAGAARRAGSGERVVPDEGIVGALLAEGGHRPVARHEGDVVAQRPELVADRVDQVRMVAARKVRPADRAVEQDVAHDREPRLPMEEHDMAGRVARAMDDLERLFAEIHRVAVLEPAIGLEGVEARKAEALALLGKLRDPEGVLALRPLDRHRVTAGELGRLSAMVDVPVRQQDLLDAGPELLERGIYAVEIAPRVHHGGPAARLAEEDGAVLRERGHGNDHQLHGMPWGTSVVPDSSPGARAPPCRARPRHGAAAGRAAPRPAPFRAWPPAPPAARRPRRRPGASAPRRGTTGRPAQARGIGA